MNRFFAAAIVLAVSLPALAAPLGGLGSSPSDFAAMGDYVYFAAETSETGRELWRTNGTAAGTTLVADLAPGSASSNPSGLSARNGVLYFLATAGSDPRWSLWRSDGTAAGTLKMPTADYGATVEALEHGVFTHGQGGTVISDGTEAGTRSVSTLDSSRPPIVVDGVAYYFVPTLDTTVFTVWRTDGSLAGTRSLGRVYRPMRVGVWEGKIYIAGEDLWRVDDDGLHGLGVGPDVIPPPPDATRTSNGTYFISGYAVRRAYDPAHTPIIMEGTQALAMAAYGDRLLVSAIYQELWASDGEAGSEARIASIASRELATAGHGVVFATGGELWSTDGTLAGTRSLRPPALEAPPRTMSFAKRPANLFAWKDGIVLFQADDGVHGLELWRTDGTAEGTRQVANLEKEGAIAGVVRGDGQPLTNVTIRIRTLEAGNGKPFFVEDVATDGQGVYFADGLLPGDYYVETINAAGFGDQLYRQQQRCTACSAFTGNPVTVVAKQTTPLDFDLKKNGRIAGRVTAARDGAPVGGITIRVMDKGMNEVAKAVSRSDGAYETPVGLVDGDYFAFTKADDAGYVDQLYRNSPCEVSNCQPTTGTPIRIAGADATGIDFSLSAKNTIAGRVTDAVSGQGLAGAIVMVHDASGQSLLATGTADANGNYIVPTFDGTYTLTAELPGFTTMLYPSTTCVAAFLCDFKAAQTVTLRGGERQQYDFALPRGAKSVEGRVLDTTTGQPIAGIEVSLVPVGTFQSKTTRSGADGRYLFPNQSPGKYFLSTGATADYFVTRYPNVQCDSACRDEGTPIEVADAPITTVDLRPLRGAEVRGSVRDPQSGKPIEGARVELTSSDSNYGRAQITKRDGTFSFRGLAPDIDLTINASASGYERARYGAEPCVAPDCPTSRGATIHTALGSRADIDLPMRRVGIIRGRVLDHQTKEPMIGTYLSTGNQFSSARTQADGTYVINVLGGRPYVLRLGGFAYVPLVSEPIAVEPGGSRTVDFALYHVGRISGRVLDETGKPLSRGYVAIYDRSGQERFWNAITNGRLDTTIPDNLGVDGFYMQVSGDGDIFDRDNVAIALGGGGYCRQAECKPTSDKLQYVAPETVATGFDFVVPRKLVKWYVTFLETSKGTEIKGAGLDVFTADGRRLLRTPPGTGEGTKQPFVLPAMPLTFKTYNANGLVDVLGDRRLCGDACEHYQGDDQKTFDVQTTFLLRPLAIASVSPAGSGLAGGGTITLRGGGFRSDTKVLIGGTPATISSQTPGVITATIPPQKTAGPASISIGNPDGNVFEVKNAFRYVEACAPVSATGDVTVANDGQLQLRVNVTGKGTVRLREGILGSPDYPLRVVGNGPTATVPAPRFLNARFSAVVTGDCQSLELELPLPAVKRRP